MGDTLVIEAVEQITLVVSKPGSDLAQNVSRREEGLAKSIGETA